MAAAKGQIAERQVDEALEELAAYAHTYVPDSASALETATACLADTLGCGILALSFPECTKLLGPVVPGTVVPNGSRVPGTDFVLDPVTAAFNIGTLIRWLDFNDTWLAAEWGHPSDNLGGLLAIADYLDRNGVAMHVRDLLHAMIQAHEIQGGLALENSYNRVGFDHVALVKIATAAIAAKLLGGSHSQIEDTLSQAFIDAGPLRTYRHAPNTGSRKSWAAGDATSRGLQLALITLKGEMGYPQALSARKWGLYDVLFKGQPFKFQRPLGSYVMENVLFKISFPAEFHAQTAVEAAIQLHPQVKDRLDAIELVTIATHESAVRIIDKQGPLHNPADRDHCLQYMTAIGLIYGELTAAHYEDDAAADPRIDRLRAKMTVQENPQYSHDYHDPDKRSIANALLITLKDGTRLGPVEVHYPIGHKLRRAEGIPLLYDKFERNLMTHFGGDKVDRILALFQDPERLHQTRVADFVRLFV